MRLLRLAATLAPLLVEACGAGMVGAPGLGPRAVEAQPVLPPETRPSEPQTPLDPAIAARLAAINEDAEAGHAAFSRQQAAAERSVAAGAGRPQGSEAWIAAQQALSALDAARGPLREASALLDALQGEPAAYAMGNRTAIAAAVARLEALAREEAAVVARLSARLA